MSGAVELENQLDQKAAQEPSPSFSYASTDALVIPFGTSYGQTTIPPLPKRPPLPSSSTNDAIAGASSLSVSAALRSDLPPLLNPPQYDQHNLHEEDYMHMNLNTRRTFLNMYKEALVRREEANRDIDFLEKEAAASNIPLLQDYATDPTIMDAPNTGQHAAATIAAYGGDPGVQHFLPTQHPLLSQQVFQPSFLLQGPGGGHIDPSLVYHRPMFFPGQSSLDPSQASLGGGQRPFTIVVSPPHVRPSDVTLYRN